MIDEVYKIFRPTLEKGGLFFMPKKNTEVPFIKGRYLHDVPVTTKLTKIQYEKLKDKCDSLNLSTSYVIRYLLSEWIDDNLRLINQ